MRAYVPGVTLHRLVCSFHQAKALRSRVKVTTLVPWRQRRGGLFWCDARRET